MKQDLKLEDIILCAVKKCYLSIELKVLRFVKICVYWNVGVLLLHLIGFSLITILLRRYTRYHNTYTLS